MKRRNFIKQTSILGATLVASPSFSFGATQFPIVRIPVNQRKFNSNIVEQTIERVSGQLKDKKLAWMFGNCFPNTLDTTVDFQLLNGKPDTYVITGDIDAMWLRDSTAQVWPYLELINKDAKLAQLIKGVINRQTHNILIDPYANAFFKNETDVGMWAKDLTEMKPGLHERKWEIDSLCYPVRLAYGYWKQTGDTSIFDAQWINGMRLLLATFKEQQRFDNNGPYKFERITGWAIDSVPLSGYGYPTKKIGLIHSMFRPSDDATIYPFLVPSNLFAAEILDNLSEIFTIVVNDKAFAAECKSFSELILKLIREHAVIEHPKFGKILAYEINGYGSYNLMDDANIPSLLSIPYLTKKFDQVIVSNTRNYVLSTENPFFFKGEIAEGIGGPHAGMDMIWPLGIIMRALTSTDDNEILLCLDMLKKSEADTGFLHEAFHKSDFKKFTRSWFAWANTLFGELILKLLKERPYLMR